MSAAVGIHQLCTHTTAAFPRQVTECLGMRPAKLELPTDLPHRLAAGAQDEVLEGLLPHNHLQHTQTAVGRDSLGKLTPNDVHLDRG